jgi:cytochrome c2
MHFAGDKPYAYPEHTYDYFRQPDGVIPGSNICVRGAKKEKFILG